MARGMAKSPPVVPLSSPGPLRRRRYGNLRPFAAAAALAAVLGGCDPVPASDSADADRRVVAAPAPSRPVRDQRPPPMHQPVDLWEDGRVARQVDAATAAADGHVVLDLGEHWTPYIFTERGQPEEDRVPNAYRETYLALAAGEFPDDHHGERASRDKYLELYGILPTLSLVRERFRESMNRPCLEKLPEEHREVLATFDGFLAYRGNDRARSRTRRHRVLVHQLADAAERQGVGHPRDLDPERLDDRGQRRLRELLELDAEHRAIEAAQARLECEGHFEGKGRYLDGGLDWATHEALAEFEKRHRVYGWGFLGGETLELLRRSPAEAEQEAVLRVLTERAMHAAGVLEDGSTFRDGEAPQFVGLDGTTKGMPNLEAALRSHLIDAFGLETPESTLAWLDGLGDDVPDERLVAFPGPELPEYYDGNMDLYVVIDRGDVWYEFPYDEEGQERNQPVERRPQTTVYVEYLDQRLPLARYGTTVGGWRSELVEGEVVWKYKNSPTGPRVWDEIVASPVWLPPEGTPPKDLLRRVPGGEGRDQYAVNYHETGPGYASAYGLVAAYHRKFRRNEDGTFRIGGDEGIRSHGSVDYMSIMRRHSHGCHRLHNHIAVRLMSFILAHRPHTRVGQQRLAFVREIQHDGYDYALELSHGGYVFDLDEPIQVQVLEGRVRGDQPTPIEHPIPKYDEEAGAYMLADGGAVEVTRTGELVPTDPPLLDGGVPDGGPLPPASPDGAATGTAGDDGLVGRAAPGGAPSAAGAEAADETGEPAGASATPGDETAG